MTTEVAAKDHRRKGAKEIDKDAIFRRRLDPKGTAFHKARPQPLAKQEGRRLDRKHSAHHGLEHHSPRELHQFVTGPNQQKPY